MGHRRTNRLDRLRRSLDPRPAAAPSPAEEPATASESHEADRHGTTVFGRLRKSAMLVIE